MPIEPSAGSAQAVHDDRLFERGADLLDHDDHVALAARLGDQQAELVAAEPGHGVRAAQDAAQAPADLDQQGVARVVTERVVDVLEAVEIHHGDGQLATLALGDRDGLFDPVAEQGAVRQAGQAVVQRLVLVDLRLAQQGVLGRLALGLVLHHDDAERRASVGLADDRERGRHPHHQPSLRFSRVSSRSEFDSPANSSSDATVTRSCSSGSRYSAMWAATCSDVLEAEEPHMAGLASTIWPSLLNVITPVIAPW